MPRCLLLVLVALATTACGTVAKARHASEIPTDGTRIAQQASPVATRLEIRTAQIRIDVEAVERAVEEATRIAAQLDARVESTRSHESWATLALRVPAARLDEALERLAGLGEEQDRSIESHDVTDQVADTEAQRANLAALRDRLRVLLERASSVDDVLAVERELTRVQTELDRLEGRIERLRGEVARSRLEVHFRETPADRILGPLGWLAKGTWWVVEKLFVIRHGS